MTKITEGEFSIRIEDEKHEFGLSVIGGELVIYAENDAYDSCSVLADKDEAKQISKWLSRAIDRGE